MVDDAVGRRFAGEVVGKRLKYGGQARHVWRRSRSESDEATRSARLLEAG